MSEFGRDDIKKFIENFEEASWNKETGGYRLLNEECGGGDAEESIYGDAALDTQGPDGYTELGDAYRPMQAELSATAPCPDSYNTAADLIVQIPEDVIEMLQPMMQELGIGCPASLAKAMADVLTVSQENGITPVYNTGRY